MAFVLLITRESRAQEDSDIYTEEYARAHIAYTDFVRLGVSSGSYVKCVKAVNFYEAGKVPRIVDINGEEFRDDGRNYDQQAGDGILTSIKTFNYVKGETSLMAGAYQLPERSTILYDEGFLHVSALPETFGFSIRCKFVWKSCYSWPLSIRELCFQTCWPFFGYWEVKECDLGFSWPS